MKNGKLSRYVNWKDEEASWEPEENLPPKYRTKPAPTDDKVVDISEDPTEEPMLVATHTNVSHDEKNEHHDGLEPITTSTTTKLKLTTSKTTTNQPTKRPLGQPATPMTVYPPKRKPTEEPESKPAKKSQSFDAVEDNTWYNVPLEAPLLGLVIDPTADAKQFVNNRLKFTQAKLIRDIGKFKRGEIVDSVEQVGNALFIRNGDHIKSFFFAIPPFQVMLQD